MSEKLNIQNMIFKLEQFWASKGCMIMPSYDEQKGGCHTEREDAAFRADALRNRTQCDGGCGRARPERTDAFRR